MPYEREAVAENTSAIPTNPQPVMREERVINPYAQRTPKAPVPGAPEKIGQPDKVVSSESPEEPTGQTAESVTLAPAAAALARKEQKHRQAEQALKDERKALDAEKAELQDLKALREKLKAKDFSGIESQVPYDEYTNYLIEKEASQDPAVQALKKVETKIEEIEKNFKSDTDKRYEAAVNERRKAVASLVQTNEAFSTIKELKQEETVVQHILDTWNEDNIDLTPEQAAKEVEELLVEKAQKWANLSKIKPKTEPTAEKNLPPLKTGTKTLTNNLTATGDLKAPRKSLHGLSDTERYAEARRRAEEKLKG